MKASVEAGPQVAGPVGVLVPELSHEVAQVKEESPSTSSHLEAAAQLHHYQGQDETAAPTVPSSKTANRTLLVFKGPGVDLAPIIGELEDKLFSEHIFDIHDMLDFPLEALQRYAPHVTNEGSLFGVLFVLADFNLDDEGLRYDFARVVGDLRLKVTQYAIIVTVFQWQSERHVLSLEEELWRHAVRQPDDRGSLVREISFVCKPTELVSVALDAIRVIEPSCLLSRDAPLRCSSVFRYKSDTVIVRQNWSTSRFRDLVLPLDNAVRRLYTRGPSGRCKFCRDHIVSLVPHLCRSCKHKENPRTIACAVDNCARNSEHVKTFGGQ